jgi:hypothetical protein
MQRRDGTLRLKMFAERTIFENRETIPLQITVLKDEAGIKMVKNVTLNGKSVNYSYADGCLQFVIDVAPESIAEIRCNTMKQLFPLRTQNPSSAGGKSPLAAISANFVTIISPATIWR